MKSDTQKFLSLSEAAERLGYGSTSTLRLYCRAGKIPGVIKIGKTWGIPLRWVDEEITKNEKPGAGGPRGKGVRGKSQKDKSADIYE